MNATQTYSWAVDRPVNSPFAHPRGILGRLAGRLLRRTSKHRELLTLLDVQPGSRILEVGYGPGALIQLLLEHSPTSEICGVDPSPEMHTMATRHIRDKAAAGRVDLRLGTSEQTGFPDRSFEHVVTANTVAIWPDLEAGLRELHRVTRPGGTALISWHSRTAPSRITRALSLPEDKLDRIQHGLEELFSTVDRHDLTHAVAFVADR